MGIILEQEAARNLKNLKNKWMLEKLHTAIAELRDRGLSASSIKRLSQTKNAYRKRVGRYRILFTIEANWKIFHIWIIEIEKSPRDYDKWMRKMKGLS